MGLFKKFAGLEHNTSTLLNFNDWLEANLGVEMYVQAPYEAGTHHTTLSLLGNLQKSDIASGFKITGDKFWVRFLLEDVLYIHRPIVGNSSWDKPIVFIRIPQSGYPYRSAVGLEWKTKHGE